MLGSHAPACTLGPALAFGQLKHVWVAPCTRNLKPETGWGVWLTRERPLRKDAHHECQPDCERRGVFGGCRGVRAKE